MALGTDEANELCRQAVILVARRLERHFRLHADVLRAELEGVRMTSERWARVSKVLGSLRSIPGELLTDDERECRACALRAIPLVEEIQHATFGHGRVDDSLRFVEGFAPDLMATLG